MEISKIILSVFLLFAQLAGKPAFEVYPKGDHRFFGKKVEITITFEVRGNAARRLTAKGMGQTFHFKKALK